MRIVVIALLLLAASVRPASAAEKPKTSDHLDLLQDYILLNAKSEREITAWAKGKRGGDLPGHIARFDDCRTERFEIDGKKLLVLLASPPTATYRTAIFVYVGSEEKGWGLLLVRYAGTADVKIETDKKRNQLRFRSKGDKLLLILPAENLEFSSLDENE